MGISSPTEPWQLVFKAKPFTSQTSHHVEADPLSHLCALISVYTCQLNGGNMNLIPLSDGSDRGGQEWECIWHNPCGNYRFKRERVSHYIHSNNYARGQQNGGESFVCMCSWGCWWSGEKDEAWERKEDWEKKRSMIEAENSLDGKGGVMWRGEEKQQMKGWKIEFRLHGWEHCLRANKRMTRCPATVLWLTVGQFPIFLMAAPPSNSLCCCSCQCPISTLKTITRLPEGGHSAESAAKSGRLPVTVHGGMLRRRIRDEREKGRGAERMDESF